jgi:hypothetical protein
MNLPIKIWLNNLSNEVDRTAQVNYQKGFAIFFYERLLHMCHCARQIINLFVNALIAMLQFCIDKINKKSKIVKNCAACSERHTVFFLSLLSNNDYFYFYRIRFSNTASNLCTLVGNGGKISTLRIELKTATF